MGTGKQALVVVTATLMLTVGLAGCLGGTGTATVFVKDSHIDEFESINVTFTKVSIHQGEEGQMSGAQHGQQGGQDGRPDTAGDTWETVFEGTKTLDLLDFDESDSRAFLGQANLSAGTYNQIVIDVQSVTGVRSDGSTADFTVTTGWAMVAGAWQVEAGEDTRLTLDINLENSVTKQGTDDWRFNPVIGRVIQEDGDGSTDTVRDDETDSTDGGTGSQTTYVKDVPPGDHFAELWIDFSEVEVHAASNDSWVTVVGDNRSLDLLRFNESGSKAFLGETNLSAGQYTHIRINVTEAWGIDHNDSRVNVTVPSGTARINRPFNISDNGTTAQVVIDLNLNRSLVRSGGDGQGMGDQGQAGSSWKLTPVIGKVVMNWVDDDPRADQADQGEDQTQDQTGSQTTYVKDTPQQNFSEVWIRFDEVQVHYAGNESWITVFDGDRAIDLLQFNESGSKAFLGEANLSVGRYTHIKINVTEAWGIENGSETNITVTTNTARVAGTWNVTANSTTQVVIDVNLTRSLHKQGDGGDYGGGGSGDWRFTPVLGRIIVTEDIDTDPRSDVPDEAQS